MIKAILFLLMLSPLPSNSTGGTIAGLIPAPKHIKGNINNGIYTSPEKEFQILVPNWDNKSEYQYMQIKEQFSKTGQYLSFGPAAFKNNIYRAEYARKLSSLSFYIELTTQKDGIFNAYIKQIEKAYKSKAILISEDVDLFSARKSFSRIYKQHTPKKKKFFKTTAEDLRYHYIDLVDYGLFNVLYWVSIPVNLDGNKKEIEKELIKRNNSEYQAFINSFKYIKTTNNKLVGTIENGVYHSKNNTFNVNIPKTSKQNYLHFNDAHIEDNSSKEIDYLIFGPSLYDYNIYHAVSLHFPLKKDKDKYIKWLLVNKLQNRSVGLTQKYFEKFSYKGLDRYYAVYESENDYFVTCITDNNDSFFEIEIDISKNTKVNPTNLNNLINREYKVFNEMLDSFTL